tara:strand:- start:431 stop:622 length:192 start_codon:yes stop_codon:yes gene_type:complete
MKMTAFLAIGIVNGRIQEGDKYDLLRAWQYLIDTGLSERLSIWHINTASLLINCGACNPRYLN